MCRPSSSTTMTVDDRIVITLYSVNVSSEESANSRDALDRRIIDLAFVRDLSDCLNNEAD